MRVHVVIIEHFKRVKSHATRGKFVVAFGITTVAALEASGLREAALVTSICTNMVWLFEC